MRTLKEPSPLYRNFFPFTTTGTVSPPDSPTPSIWTYLHRLDRCPGTQCRSSILLKYFFVCVLFPEDSPDGTELAVGVPLPSCSCPSVPSCCCCCCSLFLLKVRTFSCSKTVTSSQSLVGSLWCPRDPWRGRFDIRRHEHAMFSLICCTPPSSSSIKQSSSSSGSKLRLEES